MKLQTDETLALGVDLGVRRVRVALSRRRTGEAPRLLAVAARDAEDDPGSALCAALSELPITQRRCVLALPHEDARLHALTLPPMPAAERRRAAFYEAARFTNIPAEDAHFSLAPLTAEAWAVGIARRSAIARVRAVIRTARLRAIAFDDTALALARVHADADAIVDVAAHRTMVAVYDGDLPRLATIPSGGDDLTDGIARSLGIVTRLAEERKRSDGFSGAGEAQRDALLAAVIDAFRALAPPGLRRVVLTGNGSRVRGFAEALARAACAPVELAAIDPRLAPGLPADVLRAAGPDWSLAVGLSLWEAAA